MDWRRPVFLFLSLVGLSFVLWRMIYSLPFLPSYVVARMLSVLLLSTSSFQILCKTVVFFFSFLFVTWLSFLCSSPFWSDYWEQLATYYAGQLLKLCWRHQCQCQHSFLWRMAEKATERFRYFCLFVLFVLLCSGTASWPLNRVLRNSSAGRWGQQKVFLTLLCSPPVYVSFWRMWAVMRCWTCTTSSSSCWGMQLVSSQCSGQVHLICLFVPLSRLSSVTEHRASGIYFYQATVNSSNEEFPTWWKQVQITKQ